MSTPLQEEASNCLSLELHSYIRQLLNANPQGSLLVALLDLLKTPVCAYSLHNATNITVTVDKNLVGVPNPRSFVKL